MQARSNRRRRVSSLLLAMTLIACDSPTNSEATVAARFDELWRRFDVTYPYFVHKGIDWSAIRAEFLPRAQAVANQAELIALLGEMLGRLHDLHVALVRPDGTFVPTYTPSRPRNWDRDTWLEYIARMTWRQQPGTSWGWGRSGAIGYLTIGDWNPARVSASALDGALDSLRNTSTLIIDVRMNGGGNDAIALAFAGRFTTRAVVTELIRYRNGPRHTDFTAPVVRTLNPRGSWTYTAPVFVLIGRGVFSSNESFVSAMRELPNVTLVGDTTGGGTGNPSLHSLGEGWQYSVSRWIATTPDGIVIEDNGIPPHLVVPFDGSMFERRVDVVLDSALALAR